MDELSALMKSYYEDDDEKTNQSEKVEETRLKTSYKSKLLDLEEVCRPLSQRARDVGEEASPPHPCIASPVVEKWLKATVRKVHAKLESCCLQSFGEDSCKRLALFSQATLRNGDGVFERWLFSAQTFSKNLVFGLLPDPDGLELAREDLMRELLVAADAESAELAAFEFTQWAQGYVRGKLKCPEPESKKNRSRMVKVDCAGSKVLVQFGDAQLKLSKEHFNKLTTLFSLRMGDKYGSKVESSKEFRNALYSLLQRYDTIGGSGFQAAIPAPVFTVLKKRFGANFECFASPLNCRFPRFCSAFSDTDSVFGSCGSFFDFQPEEGSFEANPPFVDMVVERMAKHMQVLLDRSQKRDKCLSFVVIVPSKYREVLVGKFHRGLLTLRNREHTYTAGAQQKASRKRQKVASSCDTDVHFLQTDLANERWPMGEASLEELEAAFKSTV